MQDVIKEFEQFVGTKDEFILVNEVPNKERVPYLAISVGEDDKMYVMVTKEEFGLDARSTRAHFNVIHVRYVFMLFSYFLYLLKYCN
jgi:hypothetical protein